MGGTSSGNPVGYSTPMVSAITGVPPSTLHYWATTGVLEPSLVGSSGRRATRWWSLTDLVAVKAVKALRDAGCPLQTLRKAQETIEAAADDAVPESVLYWDGVDLLRISSMGDVESAVQHPGQGVLHLVAIPIGAWFERPEPGSEVDVEHLKSLAQARKQRPATPFVGSGSSESRERRQPRAS